VTVSRRDGDVEAAPSRPRQLDSSAAAPAAPGPAVPAALGPTAPGPAALGPAAPPIPRVYLRAELLTARASDGIAGPVAPDAAYAVEALRACGWQVILVGARRPDSPELAGVGWRDRIDARDPGAWLLTHDVGDDRWARPFGLRTALVGPTADPAQRPERCDAWFRDLRTAVLEILASDIQLRPIAAS
jgi:hypothetical protein